MKAKTGAFLGVPYDFRRPTWAKVKSRVWNPVDQRLLVPYAFGWGYTLNVHEVLRRLKLVGRGR